MKKIICFFTMLALCSNLYAVEMKVKVDMKDVIAAPVPLNPNTHVLSILNLPTECDSFTLEVFDATGDRVVTREYTTHNNVRWNGRNSFGKMVRTGMYIIKITAKNTKNDSYGMKTIRILVRY